MKKFIILSLCILGFVCTTFAQKSNFNSPTLNLIMELEEPNAYQKQQIINFFDGIISSAQKANLTKKEDIFKLINSKLPKEEFDGSVLLKAAFPKSEGAEPESTFGYSARSILAYIVLEAIGLNKGLYLSFINGEMFLAMPPLAESTGAGKQTKTVFYNLLENDFLAKIPYEEKLDSFTLYTQNDFKSLHTALAASTKYFEGKKTPYLRDKADIDILREAEKLAKQALKISPQNIGAIDIIVKLANYEMPYSFYNPDRSKADDIRKKISALYDIQILAIKVANHANNFVAKSPDAFICNATPYCKNSLTDEMKKSMTPKNFINAVQNSIPIRNYAAGVLATLYKQTLQDEDLFKTMAYLGNEYAKVKDIKQMPDIHIFYFQMAATSGILKNYQDFYKYKQLFDETYIPSDGYQAFDYGNMMKNANIAVDIITGKKSAEQFVMEYKEGYINDVLKDIIDGESISGYYETLSIFFAWNGYANFVEKVKNLAK